MPTRGETVPVFAGWALWTDHCADVDICVKNGAEHRSFRLASGFPPAAAGRLLRFERITAGTRSISARRGTRSERLKRDARQSERPFKRPNGCPRPSRTRPAGE
jgi:hypothetical protein